LTFISQLPADGQMDEGRGQRRSRKQLQRRERVGESGVR